MKLESMNEPIKEITHIERSFFYTRQIISNELQWTENLELSWYHGDTGNTFKMWEINENNLYFFHFLPDPKNVYVFSHTEQA